MSKTCLSKARWSRCSAWCGRRAAGFSEKDPKRRQMTAASTDWRASAPRPASLRSGLPFFPASPAATGSPMLRYSTPTRSIPTRPSRFASTVRRSSRRSTSKFRERPKRSYGSRLWPLRTGSRRACARACLRCSLRTATPASGRRCEATRTGRAGSKSAVSGRARELDLRDPDVQARHASFGKRLSLDATDSLRIDLEPIP